MASAVLRGGCHASAPTALPAGLEFPPAWPSRGTFPASLTIPLRAHSPSKALAELPGWTQPATSGSRPPGPFLRRRTAWSRATLLPPLRRSSAPGTSGSTRQRSGANPKNPAQCFFLHVRAAKSPLSLRKSRKNDTFEACHVAVITFAGLYFAFCSFVRVSWIFQEKEYVHFQMTGSERGP